MTETLVETPDPNWEIAKFRMENAYSECMVAAAPPETGLAQYISTIYKYGMSYPAARPMIIALTGADRD